jgi:hypothetical protein
MNVLISVVVLGMDVMERDHINVREKYAVDPLIRAAVIRNIKVMILAIATPLNKPIGTDIHACPILAAAGTGM